MIKNDLRPLALTFAISGIWDTVAGILYLTAIGTGRSINNPPVHHFYSVFLASFFFCFAFLQFMSAFNIRRYAFNVGCLIFGRLFYIVQLYLYMIFLKGFPSTFWFTGIVDTLFMLFYLVFAFRGGLSLKDLFLPQIDRIPKSKRT
jgi:hypothetical protein